MTTAIRPILRVGPLWRASPCGCKALVALKARGGSAPLRRTKDGKLVSRRSKTGNPACSAAASLLARRQHTAESQQVLGRCRAQARHGRDAAIRRSAGDEAGAARAERRARRGLTDKETRAKLAAAKEKRAALVAGRARPARIGVAVATHGAVSPGVADEVRSAYAAMPAKVRDMVDKSGVKLAVAGKFSDFDAASANRQPSGWPPGSTWNHADGIYHAERKTVLVAERHISLYSGQEVKSSRTAGVFRHELGHALDYNAPGDKLSNHPDFVAAYDRDVAKFPDFVRSSYDYYLQPGGRGREETFAEVFGHLNGGGSIGAGDISRSFPGVAGFIRGQGLAP